MANRWWLLTALAAVVLTLAALLLLTKQKGARPGTTPGPVATRPTPPPPRGAVAAVDAGPACPDAELLPAPALPGAEVATLLLAGDPSVRFQVDGEWTFSTPAEPKRFKAGVRAVRAEAKGLVPTELPLRLDPFKPGLVFGLVESGAVVLVPLAVACERCGMAEVGLDVSFDPAAKVETPLEAAAKALATGGWRPAAEALKAVPPSRRDEHFARLVVAAQAQAAQESKVRDWLDGKRGAEAKAWKEKKAALEKAVKDDHAEEARVALARWNLLTDRFSKLADGFGTEAPGPVQMASARFNELSQGYVAAAKAEDVLEQEATTQAATEVLATLVRELRRLKPRDCAWQARVTTGQ